VISARLPQAGLPEGVIGSHITREMMPVNNRSAQNIGYGLRALIDELAAQGVEHRNLLPFVAEFWRSSMVALLGEILDERFPSRRMLFPYPKPDSAHAYPAFFDSPLEFGCDAMEWHFDAAVLAKPCPNASSLTANICQDFCESVNVILGHKHNHQRNHDGNPKTLLPRPIPGRLGVSGRGLSFRFGKKPLGI